MYNIYDKLILPPCNCNNVAGSMDRIVVVSER